MTERQENLEAFAKRIETRIREGMQGSDSMERLLCRLMTGKDIKTAAFLGSTWVEWRYGKPRETLKVEGTIEHEHRTIDAERLTDDQLAEAERIIESAFAGSNQG